MKLLRFSGLATVSILWSTILIGLHRAHLDIFGNWPLSYLGVNHDSRLLFNGGLILSALTLLLFLWYLSVQYVTTKWFLSVIAIGQVGQIIAAIFMFGGDQPSKTIHTLAAFTLAASIPIGLWTFALSQQKPLKKLALRLAWLQTACFVVGIGSFAFVLHGAPAGQILPALAFHLWIIVITFYRLPQPDKTSKNR